MVNNMDFWKGKRVLITGHTGFKGSWLSLWLQGKGAKLIGYSQPPPTNPSLFELADVSQGMVSIIGDIRELGKLKGVFKKYDPEIVIHMAAQSLVRYSYLNPVETYETNIIGTVNVLEAVRFAESAKVILNVTSDKCYENKEWCWGYRESDAMGGHDPYSSSKGCAELVTAAYRRSYFCEGSLGKNVMVATTRAGNVIGGGDWSSDRLIPDIINAFSAKKTVKIRYPNSIRPWQYVLEPLRGYLLLSERLWNGDHFSADAMNFGANDENSKPVSWIADRLAERWGEGAGWERDGSQHLHEANCLKLDSSKAKSCLGWYPKLDLSTTLEWIVAWYKSYKDGKNMRMITEQEISRYDKT
jgi:CDP-glucose 4,6-dehydratase